MFEGASVWLSRTTRSEEACGSVFNAACETRNRLESTRTLDMNSCGQTSCGKRLDCCCRKLTSSYSSRWRCLHMRVWRAMGTNFSYGPRGLRHRSACASFDAFRRAILARLGRARGRILSNLAILRASPIELARKHRAQTPLASKVPRLDRLTVEASPNRRQW